MKVAILAGEIPATTFIDRLAISLASHGVQILLCGNINKLPKPRLHIRLVGSKKRFGRINREMVEMVWKWRMHILRGRDLNKLNQLVVKPTAIDYALAWHKPDIVHVQWAKGIENYLWVQKFGMKLVLSLRGAHINYSPLTVPHLAQSYIEVFPQLDGFHGVSEAICLKAAKYGADLNKCQVVYSGFDLKLFSKVDFRNDFTTIKTRPIKIISVGRSHWVKGYHIALDAMKLLQDYNIDYTYTIIGAADNEELLFQRNQLVLDERITFLGKVQFKEVKEYIQQADVLLLPSFEEGIANVVLEAMLLGTFVITTNCGGMEEVIQDGESGFIVPVRNPLAIAQAISKFMLTPPLTLTQIIDKAYEKVVEQHNETRMVQDMTVLYESMLKRDNEIE
jgi:colanic acid/amylovoran biosynthesis glycosyltransferase